MGRVGFFNSKDILKFNIRHIKMREKRIIKFNLKLEKLFPKQ